jgi:hypothetical protein
MLPQKFTAGDTWKWQASHPSFPASNDWQLAVHFRGPGMLDVSGTPAGDEFSFVATATATAALKAGNYQWVAVATQGEERHSIDGGFITIAPSLAAVTDPHDPRSAAARQLAAVELTIEGLLSKQHAAATFGDQSYTLQDVEKLFRIRDRLREQVRAENAAANGGKGRRILVEFSRP